MRAGLNCSHCSLHPCPFGAGDGMQGWTEQAGWLPTPLFAGVQMYKVAAQPIIPAALVAPVEMLMFPKALPAPSNVPGNRHAIRYAGALFLILADRHFFSPAHKLSA